MVTVRATLVSEVVTTNVPEAAPGTMLIADGTDATAGSLLRSSTSTPFAGAASVSMTVPVAVFVPTTEGGAIESAAIVTGGGCTVTMLDRVTPLRSRR